MISTSNDKDVGLTSGEGVALLILDGNNGEGSIVLLKVHELTDAATVMTLGDHDHGANLELVHVRHFTGGDVDLDSVVDLDVGVGVTKGASVMGDSNGNLLGGDVDLLDTAKLELSLCLLETVEDEASLGVVEQTEEIARLLKLDDVHEASGVVGISADLAINLHTTFHADLLALLPGESVLETFA